MRRTFDLHQPWFQVASLSLLVAILYHQVILDLAQDWMLDENYSHGFLIPLLSAFFLWRRRDRLRSTAGGSSIWGLVLTTLGLLLFVVASIGAEYFSQRLSLLVVIAGLVLYLGGRKLFRALLFPLAFLVFMIPWPYVIYYSVSFPLELLASRLSAAVVTAMGIPIWREGNILYLQNTTLQVVDACSGLRSLISLLALSATMAYLTQRTLLSGIVLFLAAVPVAIGANILRLSTTASLASLYGEQVAQGFFHQFSGVLVFLFAVVSLSFIAGVLRWLPAVQKNIG